MIIVGKSVAHIKSLVDYVYKEEKLAYVLDSDGLDLTSENSILLDFQTIQNDRLKKQYLSLVISPAEEKLNDEQFRKVLRSVLTELGLENNQFLAIIHDNTNHKHAHVLVNRTNYENQTFNDSYIGLKAMQVSRTVAQKFGLESAYEKRSLKTERNRFKENSFHQSLEGTIKELQEMVKEVLHHPSTLDVDDIYDHLIANGVKVDVTKHKNGTFGVKLTHNNLIVKASQVSRLITLVPDGETYGPNKNLEAILEKNLSNSLKKRTKEQIIQDMTNNPQHMATYMEELRHMTHQMTLSLSHNRRAEPTDDSEKSLQIKRNKQRKDKRKLGFKVDF